MEVYHACAGSDQMARISIHTSRGLFNRHGRAPERTDAVFIAEAIAETGYDCEVLYDLPIQDSPTESSDCDPDGQWESGAWSWWSDHAQNNVPDEHLRKDGNLLLVDANGGGCTTPTFGVAGAKEIYEEHDYQKHLPITADYPGDWRGRVFAALHEVGHFFNLGHGSGMHWNQYDRGRWLQTPNPPDQGTKNKCGEITDPHDSTLDRTILAEYYEGCAAQVMGENITSGGRVECGNTDYWKDDGAEPSVSVDVSVSNGSATCDATLHDATIDYWQWQLYDGSGTSIDYAEGNPVTFDLPGDGDYVAEAIAKTQDGEWLRGERSFSYSGGGGGSNQSPAVSISVANLHTSNGQIDCLAEASDPDGSIERYEWQLLQNGQLADSTSGNNVTLQAPEPGEYVVGVTVTDDQGATASDSVTRTWNEAPSVSINSVNVNHDAGTVDVSASASDPVDAVESFEWWLQKNGSTIDSATGQSATFSLTQGGGQYTVEVTATDEGGLSNSESQVFTYEPPTNDKPSVSISSVSTGEDGTVSASADANDPDGSVVSYVWRIEDGNNNEADTATGQSVEMQVPAPGNYTIAVTVEDDKGAQASAAQEFTYQGETQESGISKRAVAVGLALALGGAYVHERRNR